MIPVAASGLNLLGVDAAVARLGGFNPSLLFAAGEQGFWYDPSDIPLAWRRNLLTYTEQFDNAAWQKFAMNVTANAGVAPDGTNTADKLVPTAATTSHVVYNTSIITVVSGTQYTGSVYAKADGYNFLTVALNIGGGYTRVVSVDLTTGATSNAGASGTYTVTNAGNGWWRITASGLATSTNGYWELWPASTAITPGGSTGNGTDGVLVWGAQLELGSTATAYRQIVTPEISFLTYQPQPVLFTDSGGTTPVTAVEQAVGLMLDKSKGLVLGSELVTNGDFSNGITGWTQSSPGTWTVSNGVASTTAPTTGTALSQTLTGVTVGKFYAVSFNIVSTSVNTLRLDALGSGANWFFYSPGSSGVKTVYVTAQSTTIAVNAYGNTVCSVDNISVRELPGNHAFQTNNINRPILRARYNLLTYSEQFDNGVWVLLGLNAFGSGSVANTTATLDPLGGNTADFVQENLSSGGHLISYNYTTSAISYTASIYVKWPAGVTRNVRLSPVNTGASGNNRGVVFNSSGQFVAFIGGVGADPTYTSQSIGNGWWRFTVTIGAPSAGVSGDFAVGPVDGTTISYAGDGTSGIYIWGADLRPASQATGLIGPTYQRIAAATDYDTTGFLPYVAFNGTNSCMTTNSIDFATVTSDGQARRNLLTFPTAFDNARWQLNQVAATANVTIAPDGTNSADLLTAIAAQTGFKYVSYNAHNVANQTYTASVYVKPNGITRCALLVDVAWQVGGTNYDLSGSGSVISGPGAIQSVGNGWFRLTTSGAVTQARGDFGVYFQNSSGAGSWTGDGTSGIYIWGAQLEAGSAATAFQNIGTDKMTVFAGVRKLSDAAVGQLVELSTLVASNPGSFSMPAATAAGQWASFLQGSSTFVNATASGYAAPITTVNTVIQDISLSSNEVVLRINGTQAATSGASDAGAGNYGNYPLFIGARNQTSLYFNGWLTSLIGRGAATSAGQISATEQWVNGKTGAY